MALKVPKFGLPQLLKEGYKSYQGLDEAVYRNIEACKGLAMVTRTSMGPNGTENKHRAKAKRIVEGWGGEGERGEKR